NSCFALLCLGGVLRPHSSLAGSPPSGLRPPHRSELLHRDARSTADAMGDSGANISSNGTDARASLACPNCNYLNLAGFPAGLRFNPSDQELIEHLESMVLAKEGGGSRAHALINHFIPTIEEDIGICYTHPENLPGVTRDGQSKHFFHKTSKAYPTSTRTRRKIMSERSQRGSEDVEEARWHRTGNTRPLIVGGRQKGFKKILVLHNVNHGKREKTNWVMHQYHLGMSEEEKDGELVLSKVFYRCPNTTMIEQNDEKVEVTSEATPNILPVSGLQQSLQLLSPWCKCSSTKCIGMLKVTASASLYLQRCFTRLV
ncbi:hypothetical protein BDA96_06G003900, partial [Sorghum bicolor]